jgi:hypothetical protein
MKKLSVPAGATVLLTASQCSCIVAICWHAAAEFRIHHGGAAKPLSGLVVFEHQLLLSGLLLPAWMMALPLLVTAQYVQTLLVVRFPCLASAA